jgi:hypothetical protein
MKRNKIFIMFLLSVFFIVISFLSILCTKTDKPKEEKKDLMKGSLNEIVTFLKNKTDVVILGNEDGPVMVVTPERGAKIIGISLNGLKGENLLWIPDAMMTDTFWSKPRWNLGGARSWISPEDRFYLDEKNNWIVPEQMDPGKYAKESSDKESIKCSNLFEIKSKEGKDFKIKLTRSLKLLSSTPENLKENTTQFKYIGFQFTHDLENLSKGTIGKDLPFVGLWSLIQLKANGTMIIPINKIKDPRGENYRNFFNVFTPDRISVQDDNITVKMDGKFRGKLGIAPWAAKENLAYIYNGKDGNGLLFLKQFSVDPNGKYLDKPWGKPSEYGDAVEMYNDDGNMGGFCEMECHGPAKEIKEGEKISHSVTFSIFEGKIIELKKYIENYLKIEQNKIKYFD